VVNDPGTARVAAVSGGSSGIGRAIAEAFGGRGWKVAIGARGLERAREAARAVVGAGGGCHAEQLDVTDAVSIDAFYAAVERELGVVDLVVSCAAHARPGRMHERPAEAIRSEIETGLVGALLFVRRGIQRMLDCGVRGEIVFVSSSAAAVPWPLLTAYAASKAGLEQAARSLALELEGTGIRCQVVRPGNTLDTGWASDWSSQELAAVADWARSGLLRHTGMLQPAEVAGAVLAAVSVPRGVQLDHVSVSPEAPVEGE